MLTCPGLPLQEKKILAVEERAKDSVRAKEEEVSSLRISVADLESQLTEAIEETRKLREESKGIRLDIICLYLMVFVFKRLSIFSFLLQKKKHACTHKHAHTMIMIRFPF